MSEEEKKRERELLLKAISESREQIAHLEARALRIGDTLVRFGDTLRTRPEDLYTMSPRPRHVDLPADGVLRVFDDSAVREAVDLGQVFRLCDDLRVERARLRDLEATKAKLGIS